MVAAVGVLCAVGCNSHPFLDAGPGFRGIVVPLPPPSFGDAGVIAIDVEGQAQDNPPGTRVLLYEYASDRGWFTFPDGDGRYRFSEIPVDLSDNCLQLEVLEGGESLGVAELYEVVLATGDRCAQDPWCSEVDLEGMCACMDQRFSLENCGGG